MSLETYVSHLTNLSKRFASSRFATGARAVRARNRPTGQGDSRWVFPPRGIARVTRIAGPEMLRMCNANRERNGCIGIPLIGRTRPREPPQPPGRATRNERRVMRQRCKAAPGKTTPARQNDRTPHDARCGTPGAQADSPMNQNTRHPLEPYARLAPRPLRRGASPPMARALLDDVRVPPEALARQHIDTPARRDAANAAPGDDCEGPPRRSLRP